MSGATNTIKTYETDNLSLAAYLLMRDKELVDYDTNKSKAVFHFNDEDEDCKKLYVEYLNSDCKKFDSEVRDLRRLIRRK